MFEAIICNFNHLSKNAILNYSCEISVLSRGVICRRAFEEIQEEGNTLEYCTKTDIKIGNINMKLTGEFQGVRA